MSIEKKHIQEIKDCVQDIYNPEHIETLFITGSIAAGLDTPSSDVDIFLCHSDDVKKSDYKKELFTEFYYELHDKLARTPDVISPGEVLSFSQLRQSIDSISAVSPDSVLYDRSQYDGICWAGMLAGKKEIIVPISSNLRPVYELSRFVVKRWASELDPDVIMTEAEGAYSDGDKILRRTISSPGYYDAH